MGLIFNGNGDVIRAVDGSLTIQGQDFDGGGNINAGIVTGTSANFTGAVSVGGVLTYEDVKNVDSVGVVTARAGVNISGGNLQVGGTNVLNSGLALYNLDSIKIADTKELKIGSSDDLKLWHNSHSYIRTTNTGQNLYLQTTDSQVIIGEDGGHIGLVYNAGSSIVLRHNNSNKFETTAAGANLTGELNLSGEVNFTGNGHKYIDVATLNGGHSFTIRHQDGGSYETGLTLDANGAAKLFHNNIKTFETTSAGIEVTGTLVFDSSVSGGTIKLQDDQKLFLGGSDDLKLYHDGSHSYLTNSTGALYFRSGTGINFQNAGGTETYLYTEENGAVFLKYDNSTKFETTSTGATLTGKLLFNSSTEQTIKLADNRHIHLGDGVDMKIYSDGTNGIIRGMNGDLYLQSDSDVFLTDIGGNETFIKCINDGAVELYHNNSKKFWTKSDGAEVEGTFDADRVDCNGLFHINYGTSTNTNYMSSFNNNNGNMVLFRGDGIFVGNNMNTSNQSGGPNNQKIHLNTDGTVNVVDDAKFSCGDSDDLQITHTGGQNIIRSYNGRINLLAGETRMEGASGAEMLAKFVENGAVELYYDNSQRFITTNNGAELSGGGRFVIDGNATGGTARINMTRSDISWGIHNETHLRIYSQSGNTETPNKLQFAIVSGGDTRLYYDDSIKFRTTSAGIKVESTGNTPTINFTGASSNEVARIDGDQISPTAGNLRFYTETSGSCTEKCRITSDGWFKGLGNANMMSNGQVYHELNSDNPNNVILRMQHNSSMGYGIFMQINSDNSGRYSFRCYNDGSDRFYIRNDGDVENANNRYQSISDVKLKENIVDAKSQWDDLKAIRVRNFNFKSSTKLSTHKQLGVVAQEIELVCPGLVSSKPDLDADNNDLGTETKIVASSVLYMKAIKCLQEAQARIETLETKVAALEGS